jgi:prepilin peptidase CpaA
MVEIAALIVAGVACATDLRSARIPNALTFGAVVLAVLYHTAAPDGFGFGRAILGLGVGLLVFFPVFALGGLGAGDVKLMAALGTWLGWQSILQVAVFGALAGGVMALALALRRGYLGQAWRNIRMLMTHWWLFGVRPLPELTLEAGRGLRLPYALPIAAGLVVTLWQH